MVARLGRLAERHATQRYRVVLRKSSGRAHPFSRMLRVIVHFGSTRIVGVRGACQTKKLGTGKN